ncbi:hypothetical protein EVAR_45761_1 [Eumeta japonica]|uniref:ATP-dependent DNA helicase n=1 Tax=Eumeta variegata TaxID=151549 RepID=A0A4C1YXK7_EUMVA|nr:hypothetical protein EVAR_45761_1 [Eumeta japonica]
MAHKKSLEALNFTLKDLRRNNNIFGGLMMLAGDFRQTLPVVPRGTPADELNACLKASPLWNNQAAVAKLSLKRDAIRFEISARLGHAMEIDRLRTQILLHCQSSVNSIRAVSNVYRPQGNGIFIENTHSLNIIRVSTAARGESNFPKDVESDLGDEK